MKDDPLDRHMTGLAARLDAIDARLEAITRTRHKALEWIAMLSEQIESLDAFREEVRALFEPFVCKLDNLDEVTRILRHATSDVSRRIEVLEREPPVSKAG